MARTATTRRRRGSASETKPKFDVYQVVTDKIVAALENGVVPWRKPWRTLGEGLQKNVTSKRAYRGVNQWLLGMSEFDEPWWITFNKAKELGGRVRPEHARKNGGVGPELVVFWSRVKCSACKGESVPCERCNGRRSFFLLRFFNVWNVEQIEGLPDGLIPARESVPVLPPDELRMEAEALLDPYSHERGGPSLSHGGDRAFYRPDRDSVRLPAFGAFESPDAYYSTLFHELTHSTGHATRLHRPELCELKSTFGSAPYAREELVAELGASMLCALAGFDSPKLDEQAAAYIGSWLHALKDDKKLIVGASAAAQRAVDLIVGVTFTDDEPTNGKEQ